MAVPLQGPYLASAVSLVPYVQSPGVYVLSRDGRTAHYVGRSDTCLAARVAASIQAGRYTHFWFAFRSSPMQAFLAECELYHEYSPADNGNHPAVPIGAQWRCPSLACAWGTVWR
jgi:hypothetical protein